MTHKWLSMEYVGGKGAPRMGGWIRGGGVVGGVGWRSKVM